MRTETWLLLTGATLILMGGLLRRRLAGWDLKDATLDWIWRRFLRRRHSAEGTLEAKYRALKTAPGWSGRAKWAAATMAGHVAAQILGVLSLILLLVGLALMVVGGAGLIWR
jgi:hypothetical protein